MNKISSHPFAQTLGPAPYKYVGYHKGEKQCDHCNTHIKNIYEVQDGNGKVHEVGCDCILLVDDQASFVNMNEFQDHMKKMRREQAAQRKERQLAQIKIDCVEMKIICRILNGRNGKRLRLSK